MAQIIWTEPALNDLDRIANYIALDKPVAAKRLVIKIIAAIDKLSSFPEMGKKIPELRASRYKQLIVKPCRIFYRLQKNKVYILHVMRQERMGPVD